MTAIVLLTLKQLAGAGFLTTAQLRITRFSGLSHLPGDDASTPPSGPPSVVQEPPPPPAPPDMFRPKRVGFDVFGADLFTSRRREYGVVQRVQIRVSAEQNPHAPSKPKRTAAATAKRPDGSNAMFANNCALASAGRTCESKQNPVQAAVDWGGMGSVVTLLSPDPEAEVVVSHPDIKLIGLKEDADDLQSLKVQNGDGLVLEGVRIGAVSVHDSVGVSL